MLTRAPDTETARALNTLLRRKRASFIRSILRTWSRGPLLLCLVAINISTTLALRYQLPRDIQSLTLTSSALLLGDECFKRVTKLRQEKKSELNMKVSTGYGGHSQLQVFFAQPMVTLGLG
jgi:hypothetical protein